MKGSWLALGLLSALPAFAQPGGRGDGIWQRNAYYGEAQTFDPCVGHQPGSGQHHYHANPICLRAQLGDNVETIQSRRNGTIYREKAAPWTHSPILGWAFDGYPIYGPYGYRDPQSPASPVKRMKARFPVPHHDAAKLAAGLGPGHSSGRLATNER